MIRKIEIIIEIQNTYVLKKKKDKTPQKSPKK